MSTTGDRAAELRAQAENLDAIGKLEAKAFDAKRAYAETGDEKAKDKHRAAAQALADAREEQRKTAVLVASGEGNTTISPQGVTGA
jgi:hypothetical protein